MLIKPRIVVRCTAFPIQSSLERFLLQNRINSFAWNLIKTFLKISIQSFL